MIITKLALPRRTFLRGMGATLALPLLDAMIPALTAAAKTAARPVPRIGFIYTPNGVIQAQWTPAAAGRAFELSAILQPLEPFRDQVLVVSGLAHRQAESFGDGNADHHRATAAWLSGVHAWTRTTGLEIKLETTADQLAAATLGRGHPSAVARAGPREPDLDCVRQRRRLLLLQYGGLADAHQPAAGRGAPARRVRTAVRRRRHRRRSVDRRCSGASASSIR